MQLLNTSNITLERASNLKRTSGFIMAFLVMETTKQLCNYGLSESHGGKYPLPSTLLVLLIESTKLFIVLLYAVCTRESMREWRVCWKQCAPAALYFCTNMLYLVSLPSTSPPLWMILIQTRTLYTALSYVVVFGRELKAVQLVGCLLVAGSLPAARMSELHAGRHTLTTPVIIASQVAAGLSTGASLVVELLLKNDKRSMVEQQVWLYMWGAAMAAVSFAAQADFTLSHLDLRASSVGYVAAAVGASALAGLCVPIVVKNLDTIAKDYMAALNNALLSVMTAMLFPMSFTLNHLYLLSLAVLVSGIWLYEKKRCPCWPPSPQDLLPEPQQNTEEKGEKIPPV